MAGLHVRGIKEARAGYSAYCEKRRTTWPAVASNRVTTSPSRGVKAASLGKACKMHVSSCAALSLTTPKITSLTFSGTRTSAWATAAESLERQFFWAVMDVARLANQRHKRASADWERVPSSKYFRTLVILFWWFAR